MTSSILSIIGTYLGWADISTVWHSLVPLVLSLSGLGLTCLAILKMHLEPKHKKNKKDIARFWFNGAIVTIIPVLIMAIAYSIF